MGGKKPSQMYRNMEVLNRTCCKKTLLCDYEAKDYKRAPTLSE